MWFRVQLVLVQYIVVKRLRLFLCVRVCFYGFVYVLFVNVDEVRGKHMLFISMYLYQSLFFVLSTLSCNIAPFIFFLV